MARQLWLLRHAEAEPHGSRLRDADRRLTERGEAQSRAAGAALERMDVRFQDALFSPKARARQTAEIAAEAWSDEQRAVLRAAPALAGDFGAAQAIELAAGLDVDGRLLLVGHEPDLSTVVAELTGARVDLKKGGIAVVRLEGAGAALVALLRPRELALIAGVPVGAE
jgi:phosphohistidine phosphatase